MSAQRSLATTSHNIANVNTPGYSRQRVELTTREPQFIGVGYIGKGVNTAAIERIHNQFLTVQLRTSTSGDSGIKTFHQLVRQMEQILADEQTSLSTSMQQFFNAMQDVADLPSSISARQVMISEAQSLAARFQFLDDRFSALGDGVRTQLDLDISGLNSLASMIADMNTRIVSSQGGQPSNDLLDQRDQLILELSELVSVSTVDQGNGAVNVFIGSGQPIVVESTTSTVSITELYEGHFDLVLTDGTNSTPITDNITGGSIGGLLDFQSQTLEPMHNSLGRLAIGLADTINDQHRLGMNLDGEVNQPFFNVGVPVVLTPGAAPNNVTSAIVDPAVLTDSDYQLVFDGGNDYTLTRLSDNQTTAIDTGGASPFTTTAIDGFTLTITAGAAL
ncbi:MAG: flagellar hook-associated protein FlgK, partial [Gammaproteobacteria bacterium]